MKRLLAGTSSAALVLSGALAFAAPLPFSPETQGGSSKKSKKDEEKDKEKEKAAKNKSKKDETSAETSTDATAEVLPSNPLA